MKQDNMAEKINKEQTETFKAKQEKSNHFTEVSKMVEIGSDTKRKIKSRR